MTAAPPAPAPRVWISPFLAFGLVAVAAGIGALLEMLYYATTPALSEATLGTLLGVVGALIAFFLWGLLAPPNE